MKTKGIRILDKINRTVSVDLPDILEEIHNGESLYWSVLEIEGEGYSGSGSYLDFERKINDSENGLFVSWNELNALSKNFHQIIWIAILGSHNEKNLYIGTTDQQFSRTDPQIYDACDIVIEMIDSSYWEVFSKDEKLINRLVSKFKDIELLESDFQNENSDVSLFPKTYIEVEEQGVV